MGSLDIVHLPLTENRLYSEDSIHAAFIPLGVSKPSFRALLRALGVPYIILGRTRFIDALSLGIALRAVCRIGRRPFAAPGTRAARKRTRDYAYRLEPAYVAAHLTPILHELAAARTLNWKQTAAALHLDVKRCARALAEGLHARPPSEKEDVKGDALLTRAGAPPLRAGPRVPRRPG